MLRCLDPKATYEYELPGQQDLAPELRVRTVCRFLSLAASIRCRNLRASALDKGIDDAERVARLMDAFRAVVVRVVNASGDGVEALTEIGSWQDLFDWFHGMQSAQAVTEDELGKSQSRQPGGAAASAAHADGAASA